jgi:uncharacterized protein
MQPLFNPQSQEKLLRWARAAIERAVRDDPSVEIPATELSDDLRRPYAAFVTLKKHGELRGCIGKMDHARPVWENVLDAAVAAALEDPRFPPVEPPELPELRVSISVLQVPVDLPDASRFDQQTQGIIVERGWHHALLLPKVAQEYGWDARKVLETVCLKAGLLADAWRDPGTHLQVFTAFDFGEVETSS